jgi:WD40 repeat protein
VLAAVRQAAQLHEATPELRSEAIAGLALLDFPEKRRWKSSSRAALALCLSPDTRLIAEVSSNGVVIVKTTDSDSVVAKFWTGGPEVEWLGPFSPDGRWLVAATTSGIRIWDVAGKTNGPSIDRRNSWKYLRFLRKDATLVGAIESRIYLFDLPNDEVERFELPGGAQYFATSPDGSLAAYTLTNSESLHLWELRKGRDRHLLAIPDDLSVISTHWSPDGTHIAVSTLDHVIRVWTLTETNATPIAIFEGHRAEATGLLWAPDNRILVSSGWDDTTRIWDLATRREATMFQKTSWAPQFNADGTTFSVYENLSKELALSEVRKSDICILLPEPGPPQEKSPYTVQFTPDSQWLLAGCYDGMRAYRTSDGALSANLEASPIRDIIMFPDPSRHFVVLSPPTRYLGGWQTNAAGDFEFAALREAERPELARLHPKKFPWVGNLIGKIRIYPNDGEEYDLPDSFVANRAILSPGGQFVGATFLDHRAGYWRLGKDPRFQNLGPCRGYAVAFSPDDRHVYHATYLDLCSTSTDTGTNEWTVRLGDSPQPNAAIEITPDGTLMAVVMNQYKVTLVDPRTGRLLADLEHPDRQLINSIALSPDGKYLAVACSGHVVQLWNLRQMRKELAEMNLDW